jgi:hypothetical protein
MQKRIPGGGFRRAYARGEGWIVNHKKIQRLWREEGLQVSRSTIRVPLSPTGAATKSSRTVSARRFLDHPQPYVSGTFGRDREIPYRGTVADQHDRDHLFGAVPAAEVHRLRRRPGRDRVTQRRIDEERSVEAFALELQYSLQESGGAGVIHRQFHHIIGSVIEPAVVGASARVGHWPENPR